MPQPAEGWQAASAAEAGAAGAAGGVDEADRGASAEAAAASSAAQDQALSGLRRADMQGCRAPHRVLLTMR